MILDRKAIEAIIPHRQPFLLLDAVDELSDERVVARWRITGGEAFLSGHFPQYPVVPGVLILEAIAQAGAVCVLKRPEFQGRLAFFGGIDKARFKRQVVPGDELRLEVQLTRMRGTVGFASGKAYVGDQLACAADILFAIGS